MNLSELITKGDTSNAWLLDERPQMRQGRKRNVIYKSGMT